MKIETAACLCLLSLIGSSLLSGCGMNYHSPRGGFSLSKPVEPEINALDRAFFSGLNGHAEGAILTKDPLQALALQLDPPKRPNTLVAQSTMRCGIVPIKPIVPLQCEDLQPVCNTSTNEWEWSCIPRTRPMQCGIVPIKPIVPLQCKNLIPECDTESGQWHWLCEARN